MSGLLVRKLGFLKGTLSNGWCNWCRCCCYNIKECRELEERFGTHFTEKISSGDADQINMQEVKKVIGQLDRKKRIE